MNCLRSHTGKVFQYLYYVVASRQVIVLLTAQINRRTRSLQSWRYRPTRNLQQFISILLLYNIKVDGEFESDHIANMEKNVERVNTQVSEMYYIYRFRSASEINFLLPNGSCHNYFSRFAGNLA